MGHEGEARGVVHDHLEVVVSPRAAAAIAQAAFETEHPVTATVGDAPELLVAWWTSAPG
ncbi:MAG: hypothetical protein ACLQBX_16705 [Candidatus Limnocylindrales bacterium]